MPISENQPCSHPNPTQLPAGDGMEPLTSSSFRDRTSALASAVSGQKHTPPPCTPRRTWIGPSKPIARSSRRCGGNTVRTRLENPMRLVLLSFSVLILLACQPSSEAPSSGSSAVAGTSSDETALLLTEEAAASILRNFLVDCIESWNMVHGPTSTPNPTVTPTPPTSPTPESDAKRSVDSRSRGWTFEEWTEQLDRVSAGAIERAKLRVTIEWERANPGFTRGGPVPTGTHLEWWNNLVRQPMAARYAGTTQDTNPSTDIETDLETWSVTGPGIERTGDGYSPVPGIWRVFAGRRIAEPLDGPARLAIAEFKRPLDPHYDPDCSGYQKN